ncbi:MAG: AI-2E family transporter [Bacillota bacterium]|nr:AI-2E family transporter [Bacillota bacterium]
MFKDREIRLALKFVLVAAAVFIIFYTIVKLAPVISIIVIALFIFYTISPLVNFLIGIKIKPFLAGMIASLLILFSIILLFYLLIPGLIIELRQVIVFLSSEFVRDMPTLTAQLEELDQRFNLQLTEIFVEYTDQLVRQAPGNIQQLLRSLTTISMGVFSQIWAVFALVFIVFYMVRDMENVKHNVTLLFPRIYKENIVHLLSTIDEKVGAYIRGTLLKCLFVGILTWLGLSILGMPFALILGILAATLNIILYVGPFMAAIPALLLSIMPDTPNFFLILLVYIIVQILDAFVFTPFFLSKATDLSPLTVIIIVLVGAQLMGLLGIVLAIPITATLKVLLFHYYLEKRQNESTTDS